MAIQVSGGLKVALRFAYHMVIGAALFLLVSLVAGTVSWCIGKLAHYGFVSGVVLAGTHYVEIAIWILDLILYGIFLVVEAFRFVRQLLNDKGESA